jgi:outer membrane receptor protein involved in Fe transport
MRSVAVAILLGWTLSASAQLPSGAISGRVLDSSGAAIPNATVVATSQETGRVQTTQSATDGYYKIILPVGAYDVRVEATSFRPEVRQSLRLEVAQEAVLNFTLSVGSVQETVTVLAEAPLVQTTSGSLGGLVNEERVSELPLNGRNFSDLVLLQPGITVHKPTNTTAPGNKGLLFSSNGAGYSSNYMMLDGANISSIKPGSGVSLTGSMLGVEGIREFRVITNFFPAEYGMTMGSQMVVATKGGTNVFHGTVFEFLRNSALDARNFFDRKTKPDDPRLPAFRRNNFGGSFGGPIRRDKAFFFLTYEGVRESLGITQVLNTINAQARQDGFFRQANGDPINVAASVKPYLDFYPLPTEPLASDPTGASGVGRFTYIFKQPTREDYGQARWDYNFSEQDSLFVRYTIDDSVYATTDSFPDFFEEAPARGQFITLSENHTVSPTLLNMFRFSYSRTASFRDPRYGGSQDLLPLGFNPDQPMGWILPGSGITGVGLSRTIPTDAKQSIYTFSDDMFWSRGRHSLKFGALINKFAPFANSSNFFRGQYTFASLPQFLLGIPRQYLTATPGAVNLGDFRWTTFGFYGQDDWQLTPRLTLNLGLRYEFRNTFSDVGGYGSFSPDLIHDAQFTVGSEVIQNPSLRNFSPRFGFAWDVMGDASMSVRGGFGLLYDIATFGNNAASSINGRPPFATQSTVTTNLGFPHTVIPTDAVGKSIGTLDYHMQQPHMLQYNLTVDRQLPATMVVSFSYAGSRGLNLYQVKEGNPTYPSGKLDGRDFWTGQEPRLNPNWDTTELRTAGGDSWYNSLQVNLVKRLSRGLQFQSSYTWSKLLDTTQGENNSGGSAGSSVFGADPNHPSLDKGPAEYDIRHSWAFNALYELPSPSLRGVGRLLGGWRTSTILRVLTGQPFSPILSGNRSRSRVRGSGFQDRPDLVTDRKPSDIIQGGPNRYFDPTAFAIQPVGLLGTASRNMLYGPGQANVDFSLTKEFPLPWLGEADHLEFRTEVFNLFNRANFYIPVNGRSVYTADETRATSTPLSTAGTIDRTLGSARQLQLALKLVF